MVKIAQNLVTYCKKEGITLFFVESMTCGLLATKISNAIGTADVLKGGLICYTEDAKSEVVGISNALIKQHSAESQRVTDELAKNAKGICDADLYAAITGLASEGGSETAAKPVGTVFFSVLYKGKLYKEKKLFKGTPLEIKERSCLFMYELILEVLTKIESANEKENMAL